MKTLDILKTIWVILVVILCTIIYLLGASGVQLPPTAPKFVTLYSILLPVATIALGILAIKLTLKS